MGNVIQWADYVEALNAITKEQQLVSGMSVEEAATALNYTKSASGMYLKTVVSSSLESVAGATATEVATAASAEAVTNTAVNLTLVEGAGGVAEVAGLGSIALPIAATLAAATGGYLIGKELNKNEEYSTFVGNLVFSVGNFLTGQNLKYDFDEENAPTTPLLYDANGNAYLPSDMINGVKNYLNSIGTLEVPSWINQIEIAESYMGARFHYYAIVMNDYYYYYEYLFSSKPLYVIDTTYLGYPVVEILSDSDADIGNVCTGSGAWQAPPADRSIILDSVSGSSHYFSGLFVASNQDLYKNGVLYRSAYHSLPDVITKYTPATPVTTPKTDPNGKVWKQVYLPSTPPTEMPDGEAVPEVANPQPSRLTPYIAPTQPQPADVPMVIPATTPTNPILIPNPEPDTSTAPYPAPDPAIDPSQLADTPVINPVEPLPPPINTGSPTLPAVPSVPAPSSAKGLLHVYNPTPAQVDSFGEWLWTTFSGDIIDTISKLFNNPMDAVIGLHELYCSPAISATDVNIRAGYLESNVPSRLVTSRYKEINCGALSVPEYWGNYLDYSPYTKSYCYLPFIGIVELNTDDIVGSGVEITYRVDTYNGSCIAIITTAKANSAESVTYQFEGNCAVSVPITSGMMTALQNGLMGIATTALSAGATAAITAATGGTALPAAVMLGTVAAGATKQGLTSKNQVQYSGSFGSSYGAMGIKIPFLIIKRPRQKVVYGYNTNYGYPAHTMVLLSTCTGYTKAIEVDVVSPTATEAEKKMIEQLLKSGVFID